MSCEKYLRSIWDKDTLELREEFILLCLNCAHEVLGWVKLYTGGYTIKTTMDPKARTLLKVEIAEGDREAVAESFNTLMGTKPELRFRFVQDRAAFAKDLDI